MADAVNLGEYWDQLSAHDWWYMMSDDPGVYRRGSAEESRLKGIRRQSPSHDALFTEMEAWGRSLGSAGKPPRPEN